MHFLQCNTYYHIVCCVLSLRDWKNGNNVHVFVRSIRNRCLCCCHGNDWNNLPGEKKIQIWVWIVEYKLTHICRGFVLTYLQSFDATCLRSNIPNKEGWRVSFSLCTKIEKLFKFHNKMTYKLCTWNLFSKGNTGFNYMWHSLEQVKIGLKLYLVLKKKLMQMCILAFACLNY